VIYWLALALLIGLGALAAARFLSAPWWVDALFILGGALGLASAMALGMVVRRLRRTSWTGPAAATLALGAALGRSTLLAYLEVVGPAQRSEIHLWSITLACSTVVWGLVALLWGTLAISDAIGEHEKLALGSLLLSILAVSAALYALAPLSLLLGIKINLWTILGLFGLASIAYGLGRAYRYLGQRFRRRRRG
jgi:hypothetical protein